MQTADPLLSAFQRELLSQLGARLRAVRKSRGWTVTNMARELAISRTTMYSVESGDPSVTMGTYVRTLAVLGLASDLVLLGTGVAGATHPGVVAEPTTWDLHRRQDARSLALHVEAVRVLRENPERVQRALEVLDRWEASADAHSKPLRDEWRRIVVGRQWTRVLEDSEQGNQLRQASPLGFVLDPEVRSEILREFGRGATA